MSLINDQQRDKANVESTQGNLPRVTPANVEQQVQEFSVEQPQALPEEPAAENFSTTTPEQTFTEPQQEQTLQELLPDTYGGQQVTPFSPLPKPDTSPIETTPLTDVFSNVRQRGLSPYAPEVTQTSLPTVYETTPDTSALSVARQGLQGDINRYNAEEKQREIANFDAANRFSKLSSSTLQTDINVGQLLNTPDVDKPWHQSFTGFLGDVFFGTESARKAAEQGVFNPLGIVDRERGTAQPIYGRAGAGIAGFANYVFGRPLDLGVAAVGEVNKTAANFLQTFGVDKKTAETLVKKGPTGFIPGLPNLGDVFGFDFDQANKQGNLIGRALAGDNVGDLGDPKASTATNTGRVFYNPRRRVGTNFFQAAGEDPLGYYAEVAVNLFNPLDNVFDVLVGVRKAANVGQQATQEIFGRTPLALPPAKPTIVSEIVPESTKLPFDLSNITEEQSRRLANGQPRLPTAETNLPRLPGQIEQVTAEFVPEYKVSPNAYSAANPTRVVRIENGSSSVVQRLLPPAVDPTLVSPKNIAQVLPVPKSNPTQTAFTIGIGTPSVEPVTDLGALAIRPYSQVIDQINLTNPKLLEGYKGVSWQDLKAHLSRQPKLDLSEFNVIGSELVPALPEAKPQSVEKQIFELWKRDEITDEAYNTAIDRLIEDDSLTLEQALRRSDEADEVVRELKPIDTPVVTENVLTTESDLAKVTPEYIQEAVDQGQKLQFTQDALIPILSEATGKGAGILSIGARIYDVGIALQTGDNARLLRNLTDTGGLLDYVDEPLTQAFNEFKPLLGGLDIVDYRDSLLYKAIDQLDLTKVNPNDVKPYGKYINTPPDKLPPTVAAYHRKINAEWTGKQWRINKSRTTQVPISASTPKPTLDDLAEAARELAAHKQTIDIPLQQLGELIDGSVDFGRKANEGLGLRPYTLDDVTDVLENGGLPEFHPKALDSLPDNLRRLLQRGDYDSFAREAIRVGEDPLLLISNTVDNHNLILTTPQSISVIRPTKALTQLPAELYHGTALADFTPNYNLSLFGSRGELGSGLYLTNNRQIATDYALARVSENVSPQTLDSDLLPGIYQLQSSLDRTLDARAKLPSNDDFFKQLLIGLPQELQTNLKKAISRSKTATYTSFLNKLESNLVRSGLQPSEQVLKETQDTISNNLRRLGYDSVYDSKSGFALVLDETKVSAGARQTLDRPDVNTAALARYNADAYAAKFYPDRLTTDANLRDSAMKVLNQSKARVDEKLAEVQQQLIDRLGETDGVLPALDELTPPTSKPKSAQEALQELDINDICG